jgi:hypothetical protein
LRLKGEAAKLALLELDALGREAGATDIDKLDKAIGAEIVQLDRDIGLISRRRDPPAPPISALLTKRSASTMRKRKGKWQMRKGMMVRTVRR